MHENILHLCECAIIFEEYWSPLIEMAVQTGMPRPMRTAVFLATGSLSPTKVVSKEYAGIFFLGWRCLYAAVVSSRVDDTTLDLEKALKRCVAMIIGRIRSYETFWKRWVNTSRYQREPKMIGQKYREKGVLQQSPSGECAVHDAILKLAADLKLTGRY